MAAAPEATAGTTGSSGAEAGVAGITPKTGAEKPTVPEEQTTLLEASKGMDGHAVRPRSPLVVPPSMEEEDEVEEIKREES